MRVTSNLVSEMGNNENLESRNIEIKLVACRLGFRKLLSDFRFGLARDLEFGV
jgi:hypothetical protein